VTEADASTAAIDETTFAGLLEMTGGDLEFLDELVDTYLVDGEQQVELLRDAATRGATADLVRPAHSMKSSSLNVGALRLGGLARTLEEAARNGEVPHPAEWVERIAAAFDDARRELLAERERRASS
jgi:HPt (histidine-containing phosphotransfer) domain-containing protein